LIEPSDIPLEQTHLIEPLRADADAAYEAALREFLGWREKGHDRLDYVLLGAGAVAEGPEGPQPGAPGVPDRQLVRTLELRPGTVLTSMTLRMVRAARLVAVVGVGSECRAGVSVAVTGARQGGAVADIARQFPRAGVLPSGGELRWYLDSAACPTAGQT
jgi:hypothetical protein